MNFHVRINISYGKIEEIKRERKKESLPAARISLGDGGGRLVPPCACGRWARPSLLQEYARTKRSEGDGRRRAGAVVGPRRAPAALVQRGAAAPCVPRRAAGGGRRREGRGALRRGVVAAGRRWAGAPSRPAGRAAFGGGHRLWRSQTGKRKSRRRLRGGGAQMTDAVRWIEEAGGTRLGGFWKRSWRPSGLCGRDPTARDGAAVDE